MGKLVESFEQEQAVLAAILIAPQDLHDVAGKLLPDDFALPQHRELYEAMLALDTDGQLVEPAALLARLDAEKFRDVIARINLETPENPACFYANEVRSKSLLRRMAEEGIRLSQLAREWHGDAEELLADTERRLLLIRSERGNQGFKSIGEIVKRTVGKLEEQITSGSEVTGLTTGLRDLDALTGGFRPGQLVILGARPKMGKSAAALQVADHVASKRGGVGIFSLEMTEDELGPRLLANLTRINGAKFHNARTLSEYEWERITSAVAKVIEYPLFIDDTLHTTITEIRSKARRLSIATEKANTPLRLVVVDYLQLAGEYGEHREQEIAAITRGLKSLAKELHVPVLALSQLNRALEKRPDKRPTPSDLRDSGSLEQDADMVIFLYRDEIYHPNTAEKGRAELIVSINRSGPPGSVEVKFEEAFTRFSDLPRQEQLDMPKREEPPHPAEVA